MISRRFDDQPAGGKRAKISSIGFSPARSKAPDGARQSRAELVVLHAVRLAGFADTEALAERATLPVRTLHETLRLLERRGLVERFTFADSGGWILTDAGKSRDAVLVQEERETSGALPVLEHAAKKFETINPRLVQVVTDWQLRGPTDAPDRRTRILRELTDIARDLEDLMGELATQVPRFGRYPRQFAAALEKVRTGDQQWLAGTGILSCHIVWAELHEDLLSSLGHDRSAEPREGGM